MKILGLILASMLGWGTAWAGGESALPDVDMRLKRVSDHVYYVQGA